MAPKVARHLAGLGVAIGAGVSAAAAPGPGRYDGELCVTVGAQQTSCGKAQLEVQPRGLASARVDDIVYRLQIRPGHEVAVLLTQGAGELDAFVAEGGWVGRDLRFADADRQSRYALKFGRRRAR